MIVRIKNLRLRVVVGVYEWERKHPQDVVINVEFAFDGAKAMTSDDLDDTVDYKRIKKEILAAVEDTHYALIEKLAGRVLEIVLADPRVQRATVEVDKPGALRFADSVSVTASAERDGPSR